MWDSSKQKPTLSQPGTVVLVQQQEAPQQNKNTFQISPSSFHGMTGSLPPWNKRVWMCRPNTLGVNGYLSCQPCRCRGLSASGHSLSLTHKHALLCKATHYYIIALWIFAMDYWDWLREMQIKGDNFPLKHVFSQTFLQAQWCKKSKMHD